MPEKLIIFFTFHESSYTNNGTKPCFGTLSGVSSLVYWHVRCKLSFPTRPVLNKPTTLSIIIRLDEEMPAMTRNKARLIITFNNSNIWIEGQLWQQQQQRGARLVPVTQRSVGDLLKVFQLQ